MAGLVSTLLLLIVQYVSLDCTKHTLKWVYKPYGIELCRGLCQKSADTFYFIQEDLSCHRVPASCSGGAIKVSPKHRLAYEVRGELELIRLHRDLSTSPVTEESKAYLESGCTFKRGLDVCHRNDGETDQEIPDGQQTLVTDRKLQRSTDADVSPCRSDLGFQLEISVNICYKLHWETLDVTPGRAVCQGEGGDLATVKTPQIENFYVTLLNTYGRDMFFGATDAGSPGVWRWLDGSPWPAFSKSIYGKHCLEYDNYGFMDADYCGSKPQGFVCEIVLPPKYE